MQLNSKLYSEILSETFCRNKTIIPLGIRLKEKIADVFSAKYVGCVYCKNQHGEEVCVNINNSAQHTMLYYPRTGKSEFIGNLPGLHFSYTCGAYYDKHDCVYGFPRNSNQLLKIDINNKTVEEIEIGMDDIFDKNTVYGHHYGGILFGDKIIIPPRSGADYILCINLCEYTFHKINDPILKVNRFNSVVLHPNGRIYFMPYNNSSVSEFDPQTESIRVIGNYVPVNLFGGTVYSDGCIYSFSQQAGLYRTDVQNNKTELVTDKCGAVPIGGCYGTVTHFNGRIYGIPGNSKNFIEYDPTKEKVRIYAAFDDGRFNKAKWAGGQLLSNGNIYLTPAFGRFTAEIEFNNAPKISDDMERLLFGSYFNGL